MKVLNEKLEKIDSPYSTCLSAENINMNLHQLIANPGFHLIGKKIFSLLDFESLLNACLVCQSWNYFILEHGSPNWWYFGVQEARSQFNNSNMEFNSLKDWNQLFDKCLEKDLDTVKNVLRVVKACKPRQEPCLHRSGIPAHQPA